MAMTLRLDEQQTEALRETADQLGLTMADVARTAIAEFVARRPRRELLDTVLANELPRYANALRRLGE
jgi:predicted transcriptional regulator